MSVLAKLIIKNTGVLYVRMVITIFIAFYTTRLVLDALGAINFGIFNLVAGIIAMLSFLNGAMTSSTLRYLSYYKGTENTKMQMCVFSNSLIIHIIIGLVVVCMLEIGGLYIFNGFLSIPEEKIVIAKIIFQFMIVSILFTILSVPFNGILNANDNMLWISIIALTEVVIKLIVALLLFEVQTDHLIFYSIGIAIASFISFTINLIYCKIQYPECTLNLRKNINYPILRELTTFAGWNLFGAACSVGRTQGLGIILNIFLGVLLNSAYGIANQLASQINFFSTSMLRAINPQIMKSEGMGNRRRMLRLSMIASKFGFFLLALIAIPCIFEMKDILIFWLNNVPKDTVIFCQLILIGILSNQLTIGIQSGLQAIGKIKLYQSIVGSLLLFNLPIAYFMLKNNFPAYSILISYIVIEFIACTIRLYLLNKIGGLSFEEFKRKVLVKELLPTISIIFIGFFMTNYIDITYRFLLTFSISGIVFIICIYYTGLCEDEKVVINSFLNRINIYYAK